MYLDKSRLSARLPWTQRSELVLAIGVKKKVNDQQILACFRRIEQGDHHVSP